jgi:iron complex outermembrane receptor protein
MRTQLWFVIGSVAIASGLASTHSFAQSPERAADQRDPAAIEEVIVTARKREESILTIPESVSALSGFELEQAKVERIDDVSGRVSNLNLSTRTDGHPNVTIRGVGSFGNTEGVGFYLDGVQNATDASARFGDIERLEVLKGPQGTLYGGSNVGGAVKLIARRPDPSAFSGDVAVVFGDQNTKDYSGTLNVPLAKNRAALRLWGYYVQDDGYLTAHNPIRLNGESNAATVFWPSNNVCGVPFDFSNVGFNEPANSPCASIPNIAEKWRKHPNEREESGARLSLLAHLRDNLELIVMGRYYKADAGNNNWRVEDPAHLTFSRERDLTFAGRRHMDVGAGTLELNWDVGAATITFLGSATYLQRQDTTDLDVTNEVGFDLYRPEWTHFTTQELRATSAGSGPWEWLVGVYHSLKQNDWNSFANFYDTTSVLTGAPFGPGGSILPPGPLAILDTQLGDTSVPPTLAQEQTVRIYFPFENRYRVSEHSAAFLTTSYRFPSHWELGFGLRVDDWSADTHDRNAVLYGTNVPYLKQGNTELMPKASASYFFERGAMAYATYAKGYEPGGYNLYDTTGTPGMNPFSKEEADSFELGIKLPLASNRLDLNVAAFYIKYKDRQFEIQQQIAIGGIVENIINAGDTEQHGVEMDLRWRVNEFLTLTGSAGWLDAKFKPGSSVVNVNSGLSNVAGNFPPWISKYSYNLSAQFEKPISSGTKLLARFDWLGKGPYWFNMENTARNPGYDAVVNARLELGFHKRWSVAVNVENVFDQDYYTDGSVWPGDAVPGTPAPNYDPVIGTLGQPRKVTFEVRAKF